MAVFYRKIRKSQKGKRNYATLSEKQFHKNPILWTILSTDILKELVYWFHEICQKLKLMVLWDFALHKLSTSIYDLVLIYVCHFLHHPLRITQITQLSRYSCLYLGSLHPRIYLSKAKCGNLLSPKN